MFLGQPFYIFLFRQFFAQVPEALVEAARIDGCGYLRIYWHIMLPLVRPTLAALASDAGLEATGCVKLLGRRANALAMAAVRPR